MSELKRMCGRLMNRARERNVAGIEILLARTGAVSMSSHDVGSTPETEQTSDAQLRVYLSGGRLGIFEAPFQEEADLDAILDKAWSKAEKASPNEHHAPPERIDITERGLGIRDPRQRNLEQSWRDEVLANNEAAVRQISPKLLPGEFSYHEMVSDRCYMSSRGVEATEQSTLYTLRGSVRLLDRTDVDLRGQVRSRHFADVSSMPLGTDLAKRAVALITPATVPDGALPMIFEPRAVAKLVAPVAPAFDSRAIASKKSFLAGKLGQPIGSEKLHVIDDATMPGALMTRAFDDRGVAPVALPLIREGVAGSEYLAPFEARVRGTRPTGHVRRDETVWPGNLVIRPGNRSRNMIHADLGPYLIIEDVLNPEGVDPETGKVDIKVRVALGESGQTKGYVGVRKIQTTVPELFGCIVEMGSDQERYESVDSCSWVMEGVELT